MIDKAAAKLKHDGWTVAETTGFMHLIGPLWERKVGGQYTNSRLRRRTSITIAAAWCRAA